MLSSDKALRELVVSEIEADAKLYGDERRTIIEAAERVTQAEAKPVIDEPVTLIVSKNGWLRSRQGHDFDLSGLSFKEGDALLGAFRTRTTATIVILDTSGRAYSVSAMAAPGGRGDGAPVTSLVELQDGAKIAVTFAGLPEEKVLVAGEKGYGFVCSVADMSARGKSGKSFLSLEPKEVPLAPVSLTGVSEVACVSSDGRGLVFAVTEVKEMPRGKGVKLMEIEGRQKMTTAAVMEGAAPGIKAERLPALRASRGGKGRKAKL